MGGHPLAQNQEFLPSQALADLGAGQLGRFTDQGAELRLGANDPGCARVGFNSAHQYTFDVGTSHHLARSGRGLR